MPASPEGKDGKYYEVKVNCGSSKTSGLWDYNAWRLNLDYIESNSKCNLTFTSSMTKDQYEEYIESGVALRRNTYRGKNITNLWSTGELYKQIEDGTFADIYVGDYIVSEKQDSSKKNIVWLIADLDNYLNQGDVPLTKHHATVIPAYKLEDGQMNEKDSAVVGAVEGVGGYKGSEMYQSTLNTIYSKYIGPDFCPDTSNCHIIEYRNSITNAVGTNLSNQWGTNSGASSAASWENRKLDLMGEMNVYGGTVWSSSGYDIGIDNRQYAIFQLRPNLISQDLNGNRFNYWLKAVTHASAFTMVQPSGEAGALISSGIVGIRPRFLIGTNNN